MVWCNFEERTFEKWNKQASKQPFKSSLTLCCTEFWRGNYSGYKCCTESPSLHSGIIQESNPKQVKNFFSSKPYTWSLRANNITAFCCFAKKAMCQLKDRSHTKHQTIENKSQAKGNSCKQHCNEFRKIYKKMFSLLSIPRWLNYEVNISL